MRFYTLLFAYRFLSFLHYYFTITHTINRCFKKSIEMKYQEQVHENIYWLGQIVSYEIEKQLVLIHYLILSLFSNLIEPKYVRNLRMIMIIVIAVWTKCSFVRSFKSMIFLKFSVLQLLLARCFSGIRKVSEWKVCWQYDCSKFCKNIFQLKLKLFFEILTTWTALVL